MQLYSQLATLLRSPWAILPEVLETLCALVADQARGEPESTEAIRDSLALTRTALERTANGVTPRSIAVLPLAGVLTPRSTILEDFGFGTSLERFGQRFAEAVEDSGVGAIVLDVDSPGGSVYGVQELADQIFAARGSKPIVAVANPIAASAAYWIASQADELVITPSGEVGSIGVLAVHDDFSTAMEHAGIQRTYVTAGRFKAENHPFKPLSEEGRAELQATVNQYYGVFVTSVASGRGMPSKTVRGPAFGEGRMIRSGAACVAGMADRESSLSDVLIQSTQSQSSATTSGPNRLQTRLHFARLRRQNPRLPA